MDNVKKIELFIPSDNKVDDVRVLWYGRLLLLGVLMLGIDIGAIYISKYFGCDPSNFFLVLSFLFLTLYLLCYIVVWGSMRCLHIGFLFVDNKLFCFDCTKCRENLLVPVSLNYRNSVTPPPFTFPTMHDYGEKKSCPDDCNRDLEELVVLSARQSVSNIYIYEVYRIDSNGIKRKRMLSVFPVYDRHERLLSLFTMCGNG